MPESPSLTVYPDALTANLQTAKQLANGAKVLAVVKANAYGHGIEIACEAFASADGFAVARLTEAQALRSAGFDKKPLVVLSEYWQSEHLQTLETLNACPVIYQVEQLRLFQKSRLQCWVMLDTGMHRNGLLAASDLKQLDDFLSNKPDTVLMTHFAESEIESPDFTQQQIELFQKITETLPQEKSLANSGAVMQHTKSHADWVRPGIMLYGASPCPHLDIPLSCSMQLKATVIAKRTIKQGETVGYNRTWTAQKNSEIATINMGYADGYPRQANAHTPVMINKQEFQLAGRVSMDTLSVDVSASNVSVGDEVELWGPQLDVNLVATHCSTISYHLFTGVNSRVKRILG